jgi:trehalose 6-phosphate phosphatase
VPPYLVEHLIALKEKLDGALALISGRALDNIDALFSPQRFSAAGSHGAQWRIGDELGAHAPLPETFRKTVYNAFTQPGLLVEDKRYSMAVHYRQKPEAGGMIEKKLSAILADAAIPLLIMPGKMNYEILHPEHNKGAAVERFMARAPYAGRRPVFLGDDETDMFAINMCRKLGGLGFKIGNGGPYAAGEFTDPDAVRKWIASQIA